MDSREHKYRRTAMTEILPYKHLEFTVSRLMMDDIPGVTHRTLELAGKGIVDVVAKVGVGQDGGWHKALGIARYQRNGRTFFEEHTQRPIFNSAQVDPHKCDAIGCSCYSLLDGNILYGFAGERQQTQAPNPDMLAKTIGRTITPGLLRKPGLDVFGAAVARERELAVIGMMRGPVDGEHQLFRDIALATAVDQALGFSPQESHPTDVPII
jgi:hypothetical protein